MGRVYQLTENNTASTRDPVWGTTDLKLGVTAWPVQTDQSSLAINLAHVLPWGVYNTGATQDVGQNQHRSALSLSWTYLQRPKLIIGATPVFAHFQDSNDSGLSVLRQRLAEALTVFGTYRLPRQSVP